MAPHNGSLHRKMKSETQGRTMSMPSGIGDLLTEVWAMRQFELLSPRRAAEEMTDILEETPILVPNTDSGSVLDHALAEALALYLGSPPSLPELGRIAMRRMAREVIEGQRDPVTAGREVWTRIWHRVPELDAELGPIVASVTEWEDDWQHRAAYELDLRAEFGRLAGADD